MHKRHRVTLTLEQRTELDRLNSRGKTAARTLGRARMLLTDAAAGGPDRTDAQVAEAIRALHHESRPHRAPQTLSDTET